MNDELGQQILARLTAIETRIGTIETKLAPLQARLDGLPTLIRKVEMIHKDVLATLHEINGRLRAVGFLPGVLARDARKGKRRTAR